MTGTKQYSLEALPKLSLPLPLDNTPSSISGSLRHRLEGPWGLPSPEQGILCPTPPASQVMLKLLYRGWQILRAGPALGSPPGSGRVGSMNGDLAASLPRPPTRPPSFSGKFVYKAVAV